MQGLSSIDKLMPDVEKANNMVKGLKAKYEKKKATPGGFDTRTGDKAPKKKLLFGRPLGDASLAPVENAIKYIQSRGLTTQGIFRESGALPRVEALKERADSGEVVDYGQQEDGLGTDVHVVSGFVKAFLRELPDPVIPFSQVNSDL